jgi:hypothetical protein
VVKGVLWLLGLASLAAVADGLTRFASGNHSWLVIMATFWGAVNSVWMWWILGYLEVYERRPAGADRNELTASEQYELLVDQFGGQAGQPVAIPSRSGS